MSDSILIVDFDVEGLAATHALLSGAGLTAATAGTPKEFSAALRRALPPVLVIEPVLGELDGFRICEFLKRGVGDRVPAVILASRQMAEEMFAARGKQAGADCILELPRDEEKLVSLAAGLAESTPLVKTSDLPPPPAPKRPPPPPLQAGTGSDLDRLDEDDLDRVLDRAFKERPRRGAVKIDAPPRDAPPPPAPRPSPPPEVRPSTPSPARAIPLELDAVMTIPLARPVERIQERPLPSRRGPRTTQERPTSPPERRMPRPVSEARAPIRITVGPLALVVVLMAAAGAALLWQTSRPVRRTETVLPVLREEVTRKPVPEPPPAVATKPIRVTSVSSAPRVRTKPAAPVAAHMEPSIEPVPSASAPPSETEGGEVPAEPQTLTLRAPADAMLPLPPPPVQSPPGQQTGAVPSPGTEISPPELIESSRVAPVYPSLARRQRPSGRVQLRATVTVDGSIGAVEVVDESPSGVGFGEAATAAVKRWRYRPALRGGQPEPAAVSIQISFTP